MYQIYAHIKYHCLHFTVANDLVSSFRICKRCTYALFLAAMILVFTVVYLQRQFILWICISLACTGFSFCLVCFIEILANPSIYPVIVLNEMKKRDQLPIFSAHNSLDYVHLSGYLHSKQQQRQKLHITEVD